jgi:CHAT domain-containing protein
LLGLLAFAGASRADEPLSNVPPRSIRDITTLLDQYKPDPAKAAEVRKILDQAPPDTQDRKDLASFYKQKAMAAQDVGAAKEFVSAMRKVVELGGEWDLVEDLWHLGSAESMAGNLRQAMAARADILVRLPEGTSPGKRMNAYGGQAMLHARFGDLESATKALETAEAIYQAGLGTKAAIINRHTWTFNLDRYKAGLMFHRGRLAEAEALVRHAAAELPGRRQDQEMARIKRDGSTRHTDGHMAWTEYDNQASLAKAIAAQGRLTESELIARSALTDAIKAFGRYSYYTGTLVKPYVGILLVQGRYTEAEQLARAGIDIFRQVGTPDDSLNIYDLRSDLGVALVAQRRYKEALAEFTGMRAAFATMPSLQVQLARGNAHWALALIETGDTAAALAMLDTLIDTSRRWLGAEHPDTATLLALHALALARSQKPEAALKEFRAVQNVLIADALAQGDEASPLKTQTLTLLLEAYLRLLGEVRGTPIEQSVKIDAANEAFRIADLLRGQSTQAAVVASAARAAASDPLIGKEIRKQQDLQQEASALFRILRDLMLSPPEQQLPKVMADMQRRIETIRTEQKQLETELAKRFPAYANLIRPQPPSLTEARAVLRPGEALLNIFSAPGATYVWAMKKDGPIAFAVVPLNREQIGAKVATLRSALDPGDVDIARGLPRFELDTGFELYSQLLTPVAAGWQGATSLLVAANGALGQLPLALLPTQKFPEGRTALALAVRRSLPYAEYADVPWLIRQMAVTQLPSVNALVVLRKLPAGSAERSPFVGFGDPLFGKEQVAAAGARKLRNATITRSTPGSATDPTASADWLNYSAIPPLPDTRDEILSLAATLKADATKDVFLGAEASKANVKKLDLSRRRIIAFATHGLLPNDFPGVNEPSLALANPQDGKHGLLTLEDILGLKLDADWVVLSACNTAAGDGTAADAVSGLGRGFFYAGTRALLVTHWPVESVSARLLVTGLFDRQAKDATLSRAQALRQSMLALMGQNSGSFSYAHPLFWAPYALVGDGGG